MFRDKISILFLNIFQRIINLLKRRLMILGILLLTYKFSVDNVSLTTKDVSYQLNKQYKYICCIYVFVFYFFKNESKLICSLSRKFKYDFCDANDATLKLGMEQIHRRSGNYRDPHGPVIRLRQPHFHHTHVNSVRNAQLNSHFIHFVPVVLSKDSNCTSLCESWSINTSILF